MGSGYCTTRKTMFFLCMLSAGVLLSCYVFLSPLQSFMPESVLMLMIIDDAEVPDNQNPIPEISDSNSHNTRQKLDVGRILDSRPCTPDRPFLKVFMYDLPPEFHFGLLGWNGGRGKTWPDIEDRLPTYPGGLNLQHSIEYWLTLDILLSSDRRDADGPCYAIRVDNSTDADVMFVPFFSSLSYNRYSKAHGKEKIGKDKALQDKLVKFLLRQKEWKRKGGKDHLIIAHHPNSMGCARHELNSAMFILADFGRYPPKVANINKDIVAPYKHMVQRIPADESPSFENRDMLLYFQGAIYRKAGGVIRQELYYLLKDEKDVHFAFGSAHGGVHSARNGMSSSKFCLNIAGDTPSSNRLFDSIVTHCVPVIISDEIELPFEDVLNYSEFSVFVRATDALKPGFLLNLLRGIGQEEWTKMHTRLKEVMHHYEYQFPSQPEDAVQMIWAAVARKVSSRGKFRRKNRSYRLPSVSGD